MTPAQASASLVSTTLTIDDRKKEFEEYLKQREDGGFNEIKLDVRNEMRKIVAARAGRYEAAGKRVRCSVI